MRWPARRRARRRRAAPAGAAWRGRWLAVVAVAIALGLGLAFWRGVPERGWMAVLWLVAVAGYAFVGYRSGVSAPGVAPPCRAMRPRGRAGCGWRSSWAARRCCCCGGDDAAGTGGRHGGALGLDAQVLWSGSGFGFFTLTSNGAPALAYLPAGLAMRIVGDALAGAQVVGFVAALATMAGTWLVGTELFRRAGSSGQGMAGLAAGLTLACAALLHFGRLAPFLPATAVGSLAAWALLYGVRSGRRPVLVLGGMLAGLAPMLDRSGLVFLPILLLWWVGLWLRRRGAGRGRRRMRWREVALWAGGVIVVFAPAAGAWLGAPDLFAIYWQGPRWPVRRWSIGGRTCARRRLPFCGRPTPAASLAIPATLWAAWWRRSLCWGWAHCCSTWTGWWAGAC